jgi:hypothetical protein
MSAKELLEESRQKVRTKLTFVVAVLTLADGTKRMAYYDPDYGDGEFFRRLGDFVREVFDGPGS